MENTDTNTNQTENVEPTTNDAIKDASETNQSENVEETTSQNDEQSSDSGDEDNAQVEKTRQDNDSGIAAPKGFNELSEERKTLWQQERDRAVQVEGQMQNQAYAQALTPAQQLQQWGLTASDLKANRIEQEFLWDKAYTKHPELQEDEDLDRLVYGNYVARKNAGEDVTPLKVADEVMKYIEKKTNKVKESTYRQAEDDISSKMVVSPKNPKRSSSNRGETSISELKQRARQGDSSAIDELIRRTR